MTRTALYARAGAVARTRTLHSASAPKRLGGMTVARHRAEAALHRAEAALHRAEAEGTFLPAEAGELHRQGAAAASTFLAARVLQQAAGWDCSCSAGS